MHRNGTVAIPAQVRECRPTCHSCACPVFLVFPFLLLLNNSEAGKPSCRKLHVNIVTSPLTFSPLLCCGS
jgi:hypothetical protein